MNLFRFKYKYHPDEYPKRREEQKQIIKKRLDVFMELYHKGYLDDVSVDIEHQRALTRVLDAGTLYFTKGVIVKNLPNCLTIEFLVSIYI